MCIRDRSTIPRGVLARKYQNPETYKPKCHHRRVATRAKALNLDAIHDTVHEMAKDEARHGKGFEGLYNRYFKK